MSPSDRLAFFFPSLHGSLHPIFFHFNFIYLHPRRWYKQPSGSRLPFRSSSSSFSSFHFLSSRQVHVGRSYLFHVVAWKIDIIIPDVALSLRPISSLSPTLRKPSANARPINTGDRHEHALVYNLKPMVIPCLTRVLSVSAFTRSAAWYIAGLCEPKLPWESSSLLAPPLLCRICPRSLYGGKLLMGHSLGTFPVLLRSGILFSAILNSNFSASVHLLF